MVNSEYFKDSTGRWHTQAVFVEFYNSNIKYLKNIVEPHYKLKEHTDSDLPCLKDIYLELEDPTGYRLATEYLGGWDHWKKLCTLGWFNEYLTSWEEELEVRMKCKGIQKMTELAKGENAVSKDATKYLMNKEWEGKRGRPSKAEIAKNTRVQSQIQSELDSDFKLLNLNDKQR